MKLVSFLTADYNERIGLFINGQTIDLVRSAEALSLQIPFGMNDFLIGGEGCMDDARRIETAFIDGKLPDDIVVTNERPLSPVPHPPSCRDAYAFRQHVATARRNRGVPMIAEFDQYPVFYFTNHNAVFGPGEVVVEQDHLQKLDFELEAAIVIGKHGRNIRAHEADSYIAGLTIMNDLSARVLQMEEMKLNLGPAKGKDFATVIGPWLVTLDELKSKGIATESGMSWDLRMTAKHNGQQVSEGNLQDMNWTFAEIIERASYGVDIFPGDIIGSGTVGTGCYLELNGTRALSAKESGESFTPIWLQPGDSIELEIECLGMLSNSLAKAPKDWSILARKKQAEQPKAAPQPQ